MGSGTFFQDITKRVDIDDENHVIVRELSFGERRNLLTNSMKFGVSGNEMQADVDPFLLQQEIMVAAVVSWGGPGFGDTPVTRENILSLPTNIGDLIADAVDNMSRVMGDDEKKDSGSTTDGV